MSTIDFWQIGFFCLALFLATPLLGSYMARVFTGEKHFLKTLLEPLEKLIYRLAFINPAEQMTWKKYSAALIIFSSFGLLATFVLQIFQHSAPLNPQRLSDVPWLLALNTAVSFVTNTNWQAYAGETTLSYLTQALGLCVQNFMSAACGLAVLLVLIWGNFAEKKILFWAIFG